MPDTTLAGTPIRDETAFSIDPSTGVSSAPAGELVRAKAAMAALGEGRIDEDGYHAALAGEAIPEAAAPVADEAPTPAETEEPAAEA